jgi:dipeptidyl aminopeptidase/acylaminoacyl peptidase
VLAACAAAPAGENYMMPPQGLADLVDAPPTPGVSFSPDKRTMLITARPNLPSIDEVSQPEIRLGGLRINPRTNDVARRSYSIGLTLKGLEDRVERKVTGLPTKPRIRSASWSPNGDHVAFLNAVETHIELWVLDVKSAKARKLSNRSINGSYGAAMSWLPDSSGLIVKAIPATRGDAPAAPTVPAGPITQQNTGGKAPARTYQDLLKNPHDEAVFDHYVASEALFVLLDGQESALGVEGIIVGLTPSPDGRFILTQTLHRPYSYLVPASRFPRLIEVRDREGRVVRQVADLPLAEEMPIGFSSARLGPRSVQWRADAPATLCWTEAQDGGDPKAEAAVRDTVFTHAAPFGGKPQKLIDLPTRFGGMTWGTESTAMVSAWWWADRNVKTWMVNPSRLGSEPSLVWDMSWEDRYNDPGDPVMVPSGMGTRVMLFSEDGKSIFLRGQGASPEGDRPFLDRFDLESRESTRIWQSESPYYEFMAATLDRTGSRIVTRRESKTETPNYFIRSTADGSLTQLTDFPHPTPQMIGVQKELIRYEREDGVKLTGTLYLPPGHSMDDGPLPMIMWAYPQEFKSADAAGQVTDSPHRFVRMGWWDALPWLAMGYAVLDDPTLPIVGEGDEEPNDTYVKQLVAGASAAVDEVVRRGVADRHRIAIGGHSYGAFMTANLLAHSNLFAAGIARSGAYNRTLTPFGFQSEERTYWEAPEIYYNMSPFMHADKVDEPILMIHGAADNNSGTFPMQSERFYNALKGHGATARLVMLPHESHGYRARESVMHVMWEMDSWLEKYVKNAPTPSEDKGKQDQEAKPVTSS